MRKLFLLLLLGGALRAQPALTTIKDTLYNLDGSLLNGDIILSNTAFAVGASSIAAGTKTFAIRNGVVDIQLVPTDTSIPATMYTVSTVSNGQSAPALWSVPTTTAIETVAEVATLYAPGPNAAVAWSQLTGIPPIVFKFLQSGAPGSVAGSTRGDYDLDYATPNEYVCTAATGACDGVSAGNWAQVGGGGTWGSITGTLASQTDLETALNAKQASLGFTPENAANKDAASGYAGLTAGGLLKIAEMPVIPSTDVSFTQTGTYAVGTTVAARAKDTVNLRTDYGADNTGSTDATAIIQNAISDIIASGKKALYIPAGTYKISGATGILFNLSTAAGLSVYGDGAGLTVLQYVPNQVLTGAVTVFNVSGTSQSIHDLSLLNGAGMSGAFQWIGLSAGSGSFNPHFYNFEITGIYGSNTSGGSGVQTYQPFAISMINTTIGAAISAGANTLTPSSMEFIYVGQALVIGGASPETVIVTANTATTYTATFANPHLSSDSVGNDSQGYQGATIDNCYIHDSYQATAIVLNSSSNTVRACRIINIGSAVGQHGIYEQGGRNKIEHNYLEGISGYGLNGHKAVPEEDSSGSEYDGNTIVNYGFGCITIDSITSDGVNPNVASGFALDRYSTIQNNTCIERVNVSPNSAGGGISVQAPAIIANNLLEDACGSASSCSWIHSANTGLASISGNILTVLNASSTKNQVAINIGVGYSVSSHNVINNWNQGAEAIELNATYTASQGDAVNGSGTVPSRCLGINYGFTEVSGLRCFSDSIGIFALQAVAGVRIHDSNITMASSGLDALNATNMQGVISDIQIPVGYLAYQYADPSAALIIRNIDGTVQGPGSSTGVSTPAMGRLLDLPASTNVITQGLGVSLAGGLAASSTTGSTQFIGWALTGKTSTTGGIFVVAQLGAEIEAWPVDGAWTLGDYGVLSSTSAGSLHDAGAAQPTGPVSYVQFLSSGGSPGNARVRILASSAGVTGITCTNQVVTAVTTAGLPICATITSLYVDSSIAVTGGDINSLSQIVASHYSSPLPVLQGGNGTGTPSLVPGTNITVTGSWPDQTINSTAGAAGGATSGWSGTPLTFASTTTQYAPAMGGALTSATETVVSLAAPASATMSSLSVSMSAALGASATLAVTLEDGTANPSALTCTTAGGGTACVDNAHSVNVTKGDLLSFKMIASGSVSAGLPQIQISYALGTSGVGVTSVTGTASDITVSPSTCNTTCTIDLPATAVTAGSYTDPDITVDAKGRVTAASNGVRYALVTGNCAGAVLNSSSHAASIGKLGGSTGSGNCNSTTNVEYGTVLTENCTLGRLFVVSSAAGAGASDGIFTVQDEASATSVTCTVATGTTCSDTTDTAASTAGHRIWVNGTTTSTNLANLAISIECR